MDKLYGYAGKLLRVDLTSGKITEETITPEMARKWVGGTGFGAKILYDEVKKGTAWSDAENRLTIATGPLGGTSISGSGTISVVSKGPLTNGAGATQANGFFGAYLRFCGYEGVIIQGKAPKWSYLFIDGNKAELRDAAGLVGKDTWETNDAIRAELGVKNEHGVAVATIGPAGENLVKFASVFFDKGHTASKNGLGAVLGSKRLKAIAVARGTKRPTLKDPEGMTAVANQFHENMISTPAGLGSFNYGTLNLMTEQIHTNSGALPVKNYTTDVWDITPEELKKFEGPSIRATYDPKPSPCYACCHHHTATCSPCPMGRIKVLSAMSRSTSASTPSGR
jgi:aldehyde:ferredoxin oxidoreductase